MKRQSARLPPCQAMSTPLLPRSCHGQPWCQVETWVGGNIQTLKRVKWASLVRGAAVALACIATLAVSSAHGEDGWLDWWWVMGDSFSCGCLSVACELWLREERGEARGGTGVFKVDNGLIVAMLWCKQPTTVKQLTSPPSGNHCGFTGLTILAQC
jgi:hypothetical protein